MVALFDTITKEYYLQIEGRHGSFHHRTKDIHQAQQYSADEAEQLLIDTTDWEIHDIPNERLSDLIRKW